MLAFIGGSGFYKLGKMIKEHKIETEYGSALLQENELLGQRVLFIPRHGPEHKLPPHRINYRANVAALKKLEVSGVLSVYATGGISDYAPGDLVLVEDYLSFWIESTFYDDFSSGIKHVDQSNPFDTEMEKNMLEIAAVKGIEIKKGGIVATTPGPRFETKAEIRALKNVGANLVSMTLGRESPLLAEIEIPHSALVIVTNYACGISDKPLNEGEVLEMMEKKNAEVLSLLEGLVEKAR